MKFPIKFLIFPSTVRSSLFHSFFRSQSRIPAFLNLVLNGCVNGGKSSSGSGGREKRLGGAGAVDSRAKLWQKARTSKALYGKEGGSENFPAACATLNRLGRPISTFG